MVKKGDTLIEVMLAVGIFSMVAVAIVAVMSNGTAGAQTALETTLTREEIDSQAEALRFIQSAYISDSEGNGGKYFKLWNIITNLAIDLSQNPYNNDKENILKYAPSACSAFYNNSDQAAIRDRAFIINTKKLGNYTNDNNTNAPDADEIVIGYNNDRFKEAETYPHLIYKKDDNTDKTEDTSSLIADTSNYSFETASGIFILAVKEGKNSTELSTDNVSSAFYDFYIRTCWYGVGDNTPSTISTVIRLYDPVVSVDKTEEGK